MDLDEVLSTKRPGEQGIGSLLMASRTLSRTAQNKLKRPGFRDRSGYWVTGSRTGVL